jgi:1-aminocyclopropane-1-carboxylate deaminase
MAAKINNFAAGIKMEFLELKNIRIDVIKNMYQPFGVSLSVLRLDLIHPHISGNKWFKLQCYIKKALQYNKSRIVTFGGAYSNHIVATAAVCAATGLAATGIIRGEKPKVPSLTLQQAQHFGMQFHFVSREEYRAISRSGTSLDFDCESTLVIPEGGYGIEGSLGAADILTLFDMSHYSHLIAAVGTGTTLAGMVAGKEKGQKVLGISVLKNAGSIESEINQLLERQLQNDFQLLHDFHCGGYAKRSEELIDFMNSFYSETGIPTDFVYTGKLFYGVDQLIRKGFFPENADILALHSGGLQGNLSLPKDTLIFS